MPKSKWNSTAEKQSRAVNAAACLPSPSQVKRREIPMNEWKKYRKTATQEMRPYVAGEDVTSISVNTEDTLEPGGMIARNAKNPKDQWYVSKKFFEDNYEPAW